MEGTGGLPKAMNSLLSCLVAGGAAGTAVDVSLFPLDTLKTRLQSAEGFWKSGGFNRIYAGVGPAALGSAPNAALFFLTYEWTKDNLHRQINTTEKVPGLGVNEDPRVHMAAASSGEVVACLVRVPVEIVKQRRQADAQRTAVQIVRETLRSEGPSGLYRGYLTTVLREIPFSLIQFPLWEWLKRSWSNRQQRPVDPLQSAACGALAGGISAALTTPLDVAKTRIMLAEAGSEASKSSTLNAMAKIYHTNGIKGLFAGVTPRVSWISIGGFVFFGVYEKVRSILPFNSD